MSAKICFLTTASIVQVVSFCADSGTEESSLREYPVRRTIKVTLAHLCRPRNAPLVQQNDWGCQLCFYRGNGEIVAVQSER